MFGGMPLLKGGWFKCPRGEELLVVYGYQVNVLCKNLISRVAVASNCENKSDIIPLLD